MDQDQHDPDLRLESARFAPHCSCPAWALEDVNFPRRLRHDRIVAPFVLDGPINGDSFTAWVGQCLVPTLAPGDIVIADNLGSHKGQPARQLIRKAGAHLLFLPPYSPDLNPINLRRENGPPDRFLILLIFAKLKTLFRKADECTIEASWRRVGTLLDAFSPKECKKYLHHAGYVSV